MKIWIFNHYAHPPDLPGGTRHFDIGKKLIQRGHEVVIFVSSFHHYLHKETRLQPGEQWKVEDVEGIKFVWLRTPSYQSNDWRRIKNMIIFMFRARQVGRRLLSFYPEIGKPDVVIGSSPHLLTPLAAYKVAKKFRAKFVMEVRDLWPQTFIKMGEMTERNPVIKMLEILERFLYCKAKRIIILGDNMAQYIYEKGIGEEKVVWIPNGVEFSRFNVKSISAANQEFKILYLGAHSQTNALDTLINAAKLIQEQGYSDISFVLIGDGPEKENLINLASKLQLRNVNFRDAVPKNDVPWVLQEADVLVLTKHPTFAAYSGSILKLFDYMAAGKPIIFSGSDTYNPVDKCNCGYTIPPGSAEALAEAIITIYKLPSSEREIIGLRGRAFVEKYHAIQVLADKVESLLKDVVQDY